MLSQRSDPILAIATAPGRGAVGIVRISGPALARFSVALLGKTLRPREATYLPFSDANGQPIDHGLAIYFAAPHSFTGEDVLELQAHGGPVVLQLLLARCLALGAQLGDDGAGALLPNLRMAQPGEFSQRAFLNEKLDLAQAEAIADLIDASTEAAARSASRSLSGAFSQQIHALREALVHLRMLVEATLDFPEEEIDFLQKADAHGQLVHLQSELHHVLASATQGKLLREGIRVVIAGQPNAGKSSLLNALAGAELAIVTPVPGTTRDKVHETIQIDGVPIHIVDTAGLRDSQDVVEKIGVARAWEAIVAADVVLFLHDLTRCDAADYMAADRDIYAQWLRTCAPGVVMLHVWNKWDVAHAAEEMVHGLLQQLRDGQADANAGESQAAPAQPSSILLSAKTNQGLEVLRAALLQAAGWQPTDGGLFMARQRHVQALQTAQMHLVQCAAYFSVPGAYLDLVAEELRLAQESLGAITGAFGADDLLGVIFSKFCIGK